MTKTTKEFQDAYKELNIEQKKAVDTIDGPVMVTAGPGTGKTQTLSMRIANILQLTDTDPSGVLALTFTDAAATNMRARLFSLIGETAYYVTISTFHSFCTEIIRDNSDIFHVPDHHESLSDLMKFKLIEDLLLSCKASKLRPMGAPELYVRDIIKAISDLKREGVSPESFVEILGGEEQWLLENREELKKLERSKRETNLAKNLELSQIYFAYQEYLATANTFDFEDMINLVSEQFGRDVDFLARYQEIYQYFLIDEYQDTNSAQNKVVQLLSSHWGDKANIFVVGDANQSIMRFQGASLANTVSFIKEYPNATQIKLLENYRSPQSVLDVAHSVISHNPTLFQLADLRSHSDIKNKVQVVESPFEADEIENLKISISKLIESGVKPSSIVVIYHKNQNSLGLAHALSEAHIAYRIQGGGNLFEDFLIRQFLNMLFVIHKLRSSSDGLDLFTVLHYPWWGMDPLDVLKFARVATTSRSTLFDVIADTPVAVKFIAWEDFDANHTLVEFVEHVLSDSGMLNHILTLPDSHVHLARLRTLFDAVKDMNHANHDLHLADFLNDLTLMQTHGLKIPDPSFAESGEAVTLTTAHSAKGLEWDYVFIYKCIDKLWGNSGRPLLINLPESIVPEAETLKNEKNEDERRLLYVAITRAKVACTITYAKEYRSSGKSKPVMPSMFIAELGDVEHIVGDSNSLPTLGESSLSPYYPEEKLFLSDIVKDFRLTVTALNTYLECAYKFKLNNLVVIPSAKKPHLALGTAVHAALEWLYKNLQDTGEVASLSDLLHHFHIALNRELLSNTEQKLRAQQGDKILSAYYDFHKDDIKPSLYVEKKFGNGISKILLDDIELRGTTDRIEWVDDKQKEIRVIDYKTGKPKSAKAVGSGDYKRQLVFYKLLIDLDKNFKLKVGEAQLDFVEASMLTQKSGKVNYKITAAEVEELKVEVKGVMQKIRALEFPRTTDYSICLKCDFISHCWPSGLPSA